MSEQDVKKGSCVMLKKAAQDGVVCDVQVGCKGRVVCDVQAGCKRGRRVMLKQGLRR